MDKKKHGIEYVRMGLSCRKKILRAWILALRSGRYKQGHHKLRVTAPLKGGESEDRFCVLGVLCDLYVRSDEGKSRKAGAAKWDTDDLGWGWNLDDSAYCPPKTVCDWAGIGPYEVMALQDANDKDAYSDASTFEELAEAMSHSL